MTNNIRTISARWYTDPAIYERERRAVFASSWMMIGYAHQVAKPGDWFTEVIAGWPVFVQRGSDGVLRGFHNVCPHRAGPLFWDGEGCSSQVVCRYHGWAFAQDGRLLKARDFGGPLDGEADLWPVRVAMWRGFVFACLDPTVEPLDEWLGTFAQWLEPYPVETYEFRGRYLHPMDANWKTYSDNFLENYHVPLIHPSLSHEIDTLRPEFTRGVNGRWNVQFAPPRDGAQFDGIFTFVWPNFSINTFSGGMCTERWLPRGVHSTDLYMDYFFAPDADDVDDIIKASEVVADEDVQIVNVVQRNIDAGLFDVGVLSPKHEGFLVDAHAMLRASMPEVDVP